MVARASYTSRAYAELRAALLSGDLRPGERIKIDAIRARLGIGASPVREALSLLSSEGLVDRLDQRGFRAAEVSAADFEELLATRSWLEDRALREAIRRGDAAWEEAIVLAEYRLSRAPRSTDSDRFVSNAAWEEAHRSFHTALIAACGSRYLLQFCDRLYDRNIRYRNLAARETLPGPFQMVEFDFRLAK
ncbi:MAG: GntR family transcriptional regulator, partial [Pseudomonadota bacterium]